MGLRIIYGKPGSGKSEYCFQEIANQIKKETKILKLDSTKAHKVLEWKSRMKLQKTVRWTTNFVIWEKEGKPTGDLCRKQVTEYLKL